MRAFIAAFLLLAALPAAAEEPETIYGRYHRAAVSGDLEDLLKSANAKLRAEITGLSPAQREATVKMLGSEMPRAYDVLVKNVAPDRASARLVLRGPGGSVLDAKTEMLFGNVRMVAELGEWKVAEVNWSNQPPAETGAAALPRNVPAASRTPPPSAAAPQAAGSQTPAAQKAAAPARGAPMVGSPNAAPVRKFGMQKEPCVYKPVMTAEDMERCR